MRMSDVLLFNNDYGIGSKMIDERMELFGQTLNDVFKQFQKLWDDYKELLIKKSKEYEKSCPSDVSRNFQKIDEINANECCTCSAKKKQDTVRLEEKKGVGELPERVETSQVKATPALACDYTFQIFSQDFNTQGLEESFINQTKIQEIQNVNPARSKSPVFGSKKGKIRVPLSPVGAANASQESVVIINDCSPEKADSTLNISLDSEADTTATTRTMSSPIPRFSSQAPEVRTARTPKNAKKWGISTLRNVHTNVIIGSNKKLKQSKLSITTETVTDLSYCDDFFVNKSNGRDLSSKSNNSTNTNCPETNNICLEDSVIQGSPEHVKTSKIRQKIAKRIKSAPTLQENFNINAGNLTNVKPKELHKSINSENTNANLTVFDPKLSSTQYSPLPFLSTISSKLKNKEFNDSEINDDTLFVEKLIPLSDQSQQNVSFDKSIKKKKLSLKKSIAGFKTPLSISKFKEISEPEIGPNLDAVSPDRLQEQSPPRKKEKLTASNSDIPTKKKNTSPSYAYKGSPVRKKAERALLNGWSCHECQRYYEAIGLTGEELQKRKNQCSRHRSKFNEKKMTQKDYWDPDFSNSYHSTMWNDD